MTQSIKTTHHQGDITVKEDRRGDGFYEIVVSGPFKGVGGQRGIAAIISRQCVGGKWCLYETGLSGVTERFKTKKAAVERAIQITALYNQ
jgi:hypothetical protein